MIDDPNKEWESINAAIMAPSQVMLVTKITPENKL